MYILKHTLMGGDLRFAFRRPSCGSSWKAHEDGITREEDAHIQAVWDTMAGSTTYNDALHRIARGEA